MPLLHESAPCPLARVGREEDLAASQRQDGAADVSALHHHAPFRRIGQAPLQRQHRGPQIGVRRYPGNIGVDLFATDLVGPRDPIDHDPSFVKAQGQRGQASRQHGPVVEIESVLQREPGDRPVEGAGVEMDEPELRGQLRGHAALATTRGAVDRDMKWFSVPTRHPGPPACSNNRDH